MFTGRKRNEKTSADSSTNCSPKQVSDIEDVNLELGTSQLKLYNFAMANLLANGGPMLWVIFFCGRGRIVIFIERALHCHRAQINSTEFLNGVRTVIKRDNLVEAISICDATPGPVARLVKTAILNRDFGRERVRNHWKKPASAKCHGSNNGSTCSPPSRNSRHCSACSARCWDSSRRS